MLKQTIGMMMLCIGGAMGDSEKLWIPLMILVIGGMLIAFGERR